MTDYAVEAQLETGQACAQQGLWKLVRRRCKKHLMKRIHVWSSRWKSETLKRYRDLHKNLARFHGLLDADTFFFLPLLLVNNDHESLIGQSSVKDVHLHLQPLRVTYPVAVSHQAGNGLDRSPQRPLVRHFTSRLGREQPTIAVHTSVDTAMAGVISQATEPQDLGPFTKPFVSKWASRYRGVSRLPPRIYLSGSLTSLTSHDQSNNRLR